MRMEPLNEPSFAGIESEDKSNWDSTAIEDLSSPSTTPIMVNPWGKCGGCGCYVVKCISCAAC
ncbi:MAG: hypothetical protein HXS41_05070 [Theionarchaea archaeon]|nr:hypothetical protein [Theionarchaea archaeon]MBU7001920.1 hypothetical protein [Theionarchaea archaeon]MBU7020407.1 hypothetical protein [Theionarchaea archaeon]